MVTHRLFQNNALIGIVFALSFNDAYLFFFTM